MGKYGENGAPVYVPDYERSRAKELFFVNRFNLVASDMISVNRSLPDPRRAACRLKRYDLLALPNTSVGEFSCLHRLCTCISINPFSFFTPFK